jgi:hypothetical protein
MIPVASSAARVGAMYVPDSPADLCRILGLAPDEAQVEQMEALARRRGVADLRFRGEIPGWVDDQVLKSALMVLLWRVLRVPGSRATIVAPSEGPGVAVGELGNYAMGFLAEVCKTKDAVLSSIVRLPSWYRFQIGDEPGWEVRFCHNAPAVAAESARRSLTGLVIDAGDARSTLGETARELEVIANDPRGLLIRLW